MVELEALTICPDLFTIKPDGRPTGVSGDQHRKEALTAHRSMMSSAREMGRNSRLTSRWQGNESTEKLHKAVDCTQ